jgi:glyoxylase-like metal-dependent hydrolase (beta-lactamase superfamily II)
LPFGHPALPRPRSRCLIAAADPTRAGDGVECAAVKRWLRNIFIALFALVAISPVAYWWLLLEGHAPSGVEFSLSMSELRRLADTMPGDPPTAIEVEHMATFTFPAALVVTGDGWAKTELPAYAYRVLFPMRTTIIDTGLTRSTTPNLDWYDQEAAKRVQTALTQATQIVITHEHMDHIGGLAAHPHVKDLLSKTELSTEQVEHLDLAKPAHFPEHAFDDYHPLKYGGYLAIAPGIVLVKAPGHTPGSQMVFVRTANGSEYLFIGDVAWHQRNIAVQRQSPRLMTLLLGADRSAIFAELAALKKLQRAAPKLAIVPGHDGTVIARLLKSGALREHFSVR